MIQKGDRKLIRAWAMYDWANSVYSLTIVTAIFPLYFHAVTSSPDCHPCTIQFFGIPMLNDSLFSWTLSGAFLFAALLSPLLSGIADYTGSKKAYMRFFCYLGAASCASLYFFTGTENIEYGTIAFALATVGFTGSIVFYNAYLPEIAEEKDHDRVSAKGFALGYVGSVILLVLNLLLIMFPELVFDLASKRAELAIANPDWDIERLTAEARESFTGIASRLAFLEVGAWWAGFAHITFAKLPRNVFNKRPTGNRLLNGYRELRIVQRQLKDYGSLRFFLIAFFFYSMGMQTILYLATLFGTAELQLESDFLIISILVIQFVAIAGAYLFSSMSSRFGNVRTLRVAVLVWVAASLYAYFIDDKWQFLAAAFIVGLIMGGSQALSRSTYSKLLPETENHASFFAFYDISEKLAIVLGTLCFGLVHELTGSMRSAIWPIVGFFVVGLLVLGRVRMKSR